MAGSRQRNLARGRERSVQASAVSPWLVANFPSFFPVTVGAGRAGVLMFIVSWIISSAAANWWFGRRAFRKLHTQLGLWALRRSAGEFEYYDGWRRLGRTLGLWWREGIEGRTFPPTQRRSR